jgi:hypothetical protein
LFENFRECDLVAGTAVPGAVAAPSSSVGDSLLPKSSRYIDVSRGIERPYFDDVSPRNVTAIVGQSATLNCRVKHLGDRTVSSYAPITSIFTTVTNINIFVNYNNAIK